MKYSWVGIVAALAVFCGCMPPMQYVVQDPWFEADDLQGRNVVLMPALIAVEGESGHDIDAALAEVLRREISGGIIVDGKKAREILTAANGMDLLQGYYRGAYNAEWDEQGLREVRNRLQDETGALYLLIPQLKSVAYSQFIESGAEPRVAQQRYTRNEKRVSRATATLKLSIISTTDGAMVWSGETTGGTSNIKCASLELDRRKQRRPLLAVSDGEAATEFPPYPPLIEVVQAAFNGALLNIRGTSFSRRFQFMLDSEPYC